MQRQTTTATTTADGFGEFEAEFGRRIAAGDYERAGDLIRRSAELVTAENHGRFVRMLEHARTVVMVQRAFASDRLRDVRRNGSYTGRKHAVPLYTVEG